MSYYNNLAWTLTLMAAAACSAEGPNVVSYDSVERSNTPGSGQTSSPATSASGGGGVGGGGVGGGAVSPASNSGASVQPSSPQAGAVSPEPPGNVSPTPTMPGGGAGGCAASEIVMDQTGQVSDDCSGIEGVWYCYEDGINSTSCMDGSPPFQQGAMCLEGVTTVDPQYEAWGAGVGLTLNHPEGSGAKRAFDADAANLVGFSVTITGDLGGLDLRIGYTVSASENDVAPFVQVARVGTHEVLFSDATISWETNAPPVNPSRVFDVQVQVVGGEAAASYDFCVTELTPIYAT